MGQIRHGCATTTHAVRAAIQRSQASLAALSATYGINPKTARKWRNRTSVEDLKTGPKKPHSTILSTEEEAIIVAFRCHTLLSLDDCLYALQATIPQLTRSSLHRCLKRHGISRLPEMTGDKTEKKQFKAYTIGYFHIDIAEIRTRKASFISLSLSIAPRNSPSLNCTNVPTSRQPRHSWKHSSRPCRAIFTRS